MHFYIILFYCCRERIKYPKFNSMVPKYTIPSSFPVPLQKLIKECRTVHEWFLTQPIVFARPHTHMEAPRGVIARMSALCTGCCTPGDPDSRRLTLETATRISLVCLIANLPLISRLFKRS